MVVGVVVGLFVAMRLINAKEDHVRKQIIDYYGVIAITVIPNDEVSERDENSDPFDDDGFSHDGIPMGFNDWYPNEVPFGIERSISRV